MEKTKCWDEYQEIVDQYKKIQNREKEILTELDNTTDIAKKIKLEEECKALPFLELERKRLKLMNKCFYRVN